MINIDRNKRGFSLIEALVSMLILSVFFAATAKVWSKRQKPEKPKYPHGYFECYYDGSTLKQGIGREQQSSATENATGGKCVFDSQGGNLVYNVIVLYATPSVYSSALGCGGTSRCGGNTETIPFMAGTLSMTPPTLGSNSMGVTNTTTGVSSSKYYSLSDDRNMTYTQIRNHINFTNHKSNILKSNAGNTGYNGGIMISW